MKITFNISTIEVLIEGKDWSLDGRTLNNLIKGFPKENRKFRWTDKTWIVDNIEPFKSQIKAFDFGYTERDLQQAEQDCQEFLSQFDNPFLY